MTLFKKSHFQAAAVAVMLCGLMPAPLLAAAEKAPNGYVSICGRTQQVRLAIQNEVAVLRFISGTESHVRCREIMPSELSKIEYLQLHEKEISSLKPGDFAGLDGLKTLNLEGNKLSVLDASVFSGLNHLERLILTRNPLKTIGAELSRLSGLKLVDYSGCKLSALSPAAFAGNPGLESVFLSDNQVENLPKGIFKQNAALKIVDVSNNPIGMSGIREAYANGSIPGVCIRTTNDASPSCNGSRQNTAVYSPDSTDPIYRDMERLRYFVRAHWRLPLDVSVSFSTPGRVDLKNPGRRAGEERLLQRQLDEIRDAYQRAAFDFFDVQIRFIAPDSARSAPVITFNEQKIGMDIILKTAAGAGQRSLLISDDQILETLAAHFSRTRSVEWFKKEEPRYLQAALKRDFEKVARMDDELRFDMTRLGDLIHTARARRTRDTWNTFFSATELADARMIQFRVLLTLQRLENTMARWKLASDAPGFPYPSEVRVLLSECSGMYRTYMDWFLNIVVGGRASLNIFDETWFLRNPLYKIFDAEVPAGFINLEGRLSTRIPGGAVRNLLKDRLSRPLSHYLNLMQSLSKKVTADDIRRSPLSQQIEQAIGRISYNRELHSKHKISHLLALKELWDATAKNSVMFPIYQVSMEVATTIGDTRTINPLPAITDQQMEDMKSILKPGDLLIERTDHYLSNAFLGGFWPHGILYLGPKEEWSQLRLADGTALAEDPWIAKKILPNYVSEKDHRPALVIEAISEGVVFNSLEEAAQKDYIAVFRPKFAPNEQEAKIAGAIKRALKYHGRAYDFEFDFFTDDKMVCTELLYRAYHPDINFQIQKQAAKKPEPPVPGLMVIAGRDTMPANEVVKLALYMLDHPEPNPAIGYTGRTLEFVRLYMKEGEGQPARIYEGKQGIDILRKTVE